MNDFLSQVRPALLAMIVFTALCGLIYPFAVTGAAQAIFPHQAEGSLVTRGGDVVGSSLIGQPFDQPAYFWGRPQTVSNMGPLHPQLHQDVAARIAGLRAADPTNTLPVPIDLVTGSASGLDPDISPAAAYYQAPRVARVRDVPLAAVRALIDRHVEGRWLGIFGDPHVNVLALDLDLDALAAAKR